MDFVAGVRPGSRVSCHTSVGRTGTLLDERPGEHRCFTLYQVLSQSNVRKRGPCSRHDETQSEPAGGHGDHRGSRGFRGYPSAEPWAHAPLPGQWHRLPELGHDRMPASRRTRVWRRFILLAVGLSLRSHLFPLTQATGCGLPKSNSVPREHLLIQETPSSFLPWS